MIDKKLAKKIIELILEGVNTASALCEAIPEFTMSDVKFAAWGLVGRGDIHLTQDRKLAVSNPTTKQIQLAMTKSLKKVRRQIVMEAVDKILDGMEQSDKFTYMDKFKIEIEGEVTESAGFDSTSLTIGSTDITIKDNKYNIGDGWKNI